MKKISPDVQKLLLRLVLGFVFIIAGYKIAFPADTAALVVSYTNPDTGWISPFFSSWIESSLGIDVGLFLFYQGLLEMGIGLLVILGIVTPVAAVMMGLLYFSFTIANPVAGAIRLSRDLALMGFSFALAYYGAGKFSLDKKFGVLYRKGKEEIFTLLLRYSLGFTLMVSAVFSGGVMNNPLNTTIHVALVFVIGLLLILNVKVKWVALLLGVWLLYAIGSVMVAKPTLFKAFDSPKREIAFLIGALLLFFAGKRDTFLIPFKNLVK